LCGAAIATLGLNSEEFYDLDPREFYYALKSVSDYRLAKSREVYEVARLQTVWLINVQPQVKPKLRRVQDLIKFPWEGGTVPGKKQTMEEMKNFIELFATGKKVKHVQRHPDDPPTGWLEKQKKK
jgi:hypothetical protein